MEPSALKRLGQKEMQAKQRQETISRTGFKLKLPARILWVFCRHAQQVK